MTVVIVDSEDRQPLTAMGGVDADNAVTLRRISTAFKKLKSS
jgi:hypothetical protein